MRFDQGRRVPDWHPRLHSYLNRETLAQFRWGEADCGTLAIGAISAITDIDISSEISGKYEARSEAESISRRGVIGFAFETARKYGFIRIPPEFAMSGDVALVLDPITGPGFAVKWGGEFVTRRLGKVGLSPCKHPPRCAWRIA